MEMINIVFSYAVYAFLYIGHSFIAMSKVYPVLTFVILFALLFIMLGISSTGKKKTLKEQLENPPMWVDKTANCLAFIIMAPINVLFFLIIKCIHLYDYFNLKMLQKKLRKGMK